MKLAIIHKNNDSTVELVEQFKSVCPFETCSLSSLSNGTEYDLIIAFGGDGTILKAVPYAVQSSKPIIAVNTGNLGFLSAYSPDQLKQLLQDISNNCIEYEEKNLLECNFDNKTCYALNEFVIEREHSLRCESNRFTVYFNGNFANEYTADGILIATPTGSTGYSFSAGGAVLHPNLNGYSVTAICSHLPNCASYVVPTDYNVEIKVSKSTKPCNVFCDGVFVGNIECERSIKINQSNKTIKIAKSNDFFAVVRSKLLGFNK